MPNAKIGELNGRYALLFKLCLTIGPIFVTSGFAAQGWIINRLSQIDRSIAEIDKKQSVMEGNRFSSADGLKVWEAIGSIRTDLAKVPSEIPPKWFVDRVDRIESNVDRLATQTLELSRIVGELHKEK